MSAIVLGMIIMVVIMQLDAPYAVQSLGGAIVTTIVLMAGGILDVPKSKSNQQLNQMCVFLISFPCVAGCSQHPAFFCGCKDGDD